MENPYAPISATLDEVVDETPTIKTFVLSPEQPVEFRAGQFVQITVPGLGEAPFTPSSSPYEKGFLEVTVLRTGRVTDALHATPRLGCAGRSARATRWSSVRGRRSSSWGAAWAWPRCAR